MTPEELAAQEAAAVKATAEAKAAEEAATAKAAEEAATAKAAEEAAAAKAAEEAEAARKEAEAGMSARERELLHEVMDKKNKLKTEAERAAALEAELAKFQGIDLEKVRAMIEAEKAREEKDLEARGEFDRLKQRIAEERATEKAASEARIAELQASLSTKDSEIDELTVGQTFATSSYITEDLVLTPTKARALYGSHFDKVDGKIVGYDKPKGAADRTMLVGADGEALPFNDAMRKVIESDPEKDTLIKAKLTPGAGSRSSATGQVKTPQVSSELHGVSRIAAGLKKAK